MQRVSKEKPSTAATTEGIPKLNDSIVEAERLLRKGFKLCALHPMSKQPVGNGWHLNPVTAIDPKAGGYGLLLAPNGLCSIDPDNVELAREGLRRCGFDLEELMAAGVRTSSTRPGSGGRTAFKAYPGLLRVVFRTKTQGTILELRAGQANLQDCLPGTTYLGKDGSGPYVQDYANGRTFDEAPELSPALLAWWLRMCEDGEYLRAQQALFCGPDAQLSVSDATGSQLAFKSPYRLDFNATHDVPTILERHCYTTADDERWAPVTATGAPCVRLIPGKDGLWQSDHASDPLHGTFDAWTAFVVLDHAGDLEAAEEAHGDVMRAITADDFDVLRPPKPKGALIVQTAAEFCASVGKLEWIVPNVLPQGEVAVIFGESGAGKSFFTLHMLASIALGRPWYAKATKRMRVVYGCFEGVQGAAGRLAAYQQHHGVALGEQLMVLRGPVNLLKDDSTREVIEALKALGDVGLLAIDTLAQVTPGADENTGKDMGAVLARARRIHLETGAMVLLIAHSGKDASKGIRGWSGIKGALDAEICVENVTDGVKCATVTKLKDGRGEGDRYTFELQSVVLDFGGGEDGEGRTSAVAVETAAKGRSPRGSEKPLGSQQQLLLRVVSELCEVEARVSVNDAIDAAIAQIPGPSRGGRDTRRMVLLRAWNGLVARGAFTVEGGFIKHPAGALED